MEEKIFKVLYRLIIQNHISEDEAFNLMKIVFSKDKIYDYINWPAPSTTITNNPHKNNPLNPWWYTKTADGNDYLKTYTTCTANSDDSTTHAVAYNTTLGNISIDPDSELLGKDSDITKNCIDTIE